MTRKERRKAVRADRGEVHPLRGIAMAELPTEERAGQGDFVIEAVTDEDDRPVSNGAKRVRFVDVHPLDAYLRRGVIDWRQHDAGQWLARTYARAVTVRSGVASFNERVQSSLLPGTPVVDAMVELDRAFIAAGLATYAENPSPMRVKMRSGEVCEEVQTRLIFTREASVAIAVCAYGEWAGDKRPIDRLCRALDALADTLRIGPRAERVNRGKAKKAA